MANQVYQSNMQPYGQQSSMGQGVWNSNSMPRTNSNSFLNSFKNLFMGSPQYSEQLQQFTPEQQGVMQQLLQRGLGGLDQFDFGPIEEQARTGFQQKTIPSIAERFSSLGGGQRSSAFNNSMAQAGAGLEQSLAAMKQQYNLQRQPMFQQMLNMGLRPQFENMIHQRQPGLFEGAASSVGSMLPLLMMGL